METLQTILVGLPPFDIEKATGHERLAFLATALEAEQLWRDSIMEWDFGIPLDTGPGHATCGSSGCALGLSELVFKLKNFANGHLHRVAEFFGIISEDAGAIFYDQEDVYSDSPTPKEVAREIRRILKERYDYAF